MPIRSITYLWWMEYLSLVFDEWLFLCNLCPTLSWVDWHTMKVERWIWDTVHAAFCTHHANALLVGVFVIIIHVVICIAIGLFKGDIKVWWNSPTGLCFVDLNPSLRCSQILFQIFICSLIIWECFFQLTNLGLQLESSNAAFLMSSNPNVSSLLCNLTNSSITYRDNNYSGCCNFQKWLANNTTAEEWPLSM